MTDEDHAAAAGVLGPVLAKRLHGSEDPDPYLGRRWLKGCEATVWRIIALSADDPGIRSAEARQRDFQAAWGQPSHGARLVSARLVTARAGGYPPV
ncbi:hypothetical protein ACFYP6_13930 [Streptomyces goshikiensis]|uniref:hypothetical protein n=1 Tax=Streptomyces goshikiensis TaxID=1942 RepID=UPI0036D0B104